MARTGLTWKGDEVVELVTRNMAAALGEIGLEVEKGAKSNLWVGHGVDTKSLKNSLHTAPPGYNWSGDHSYPDGPSRGGHLVPAERSGKALHLEVGSGQNYAIWVLLKYYPYLWVGLQRGVARAASILRKYRVGR